MYEMDKMLEVTNKATEEIVAYLNSQPSVLRVENVEEYRTYQVKDIDLLILTQLSNGQKVTKSIEIKADRWYRTGNYFFETISNYEKKTLGCFMYTEADYLFYYFVDPKELHILPMPQTRDWFIKNQKRFEIKVVNTAVQGDSYSSQGRVVPRHIVRREVKNVKIIKI
jgi:hypothetical protein